MKHLERSLTLLVALLIVHATGGVSASAIEWKTDFAKAQETAAAEGKTLFLRFTGSDWCPPCNAMTRSIFSKPEFAQACGDGFVFVELDYPKTADQDAAVTEQNKKLAETYRIPAFPCVILADAKGRPFYLDSEPSLLPAKRYGERMKERLTILERRDGHFKKAEEKEGAEKAKELHNGLKTLDSELIGRHYADVMERITELDTEDTLKIKAELEHKKLTMALSKELRVLARKKDFEGYDKRLQAFVKERKLKGEQHQELLFRLKLRMYGPDRLPEAKKLMDEIIKLDKKSEWADKALLIRQRIELLEESAAKRTTPTP